MVILTIFWQGAFLSFGDEGKSSYPDEQEHKSVGGVKVSIVAFQAIDPGSIPGRRNFFTDFSSVLAMKGLSNVSCLHAFVWSLK